MESIKNTYRAYLNSFPAFYAFLAGFVFFEPCLAEYAFLLAVPGLLSRMRWDTRAIGSACLLFVPLLASTIYGRFAFGSVDPRFVAIEFYLFAFYLTARSVFEAGAKEREEIIRGVFRAMAIASFIGIAAGLIVYARGSSALGLRIVYQNRLYGFFKDTNVFASYMLVTFFYHADEFFRTSERRRAARSGVISVGLSVGMLLTFSRSVWMAYGLGLLVLLVRHIAAPEKSGRIKAVAVAAALGAVLVLLFSGVVRVGDLNVSGILRSRFGLVSYDGKRFEAQARSLEMFAESPVFGVGPGNYEKYSDLSAHNLYARILGERGALGAIAFLLFAALLIRRALRDRIELWLFLGIGSIVLESFFIDTLHWRHLWMLLLLI